MKMSNLNVVASHEAMERILAAGGQITRIVTCDNECCSCYSHDAAFQQVTVPVQVEERHEGNGCTDEQCACVSHPPGYPGCTLYQLPDGSWLVAYDSCSTGHYPRLEVCPDPEAERIKMAWMAEDYLADCMLYD